MRLAVELDQTLARSIVGSLRRSRANLIVSAEENDPYFTPIIAD
jgi:hypothetical protein